MGYFDAISQAKAEFDAEQQANAASDAQKDRDLRALGAKR